MNIYLIRHGQTDFNRDGKFQGTTDVDLNELGIHQANRIGERLRSKAIDIIYASDYKRVVQTARIISKYTDSEIVIREELREIKMGEWEALNQEEIKSKYADYYKEWAEHNDDLPYPGGECGADVEKRAMKLLGSIAGLRHENAAIVTSGGVIRILLSSFMGLKQQNRFLIDTDNCGLSIVRHDTQNGKYYINCINDTSHLG